MAGAKIKAKLLPKSSFLPPKKEEQKEKSDRAKRP